MSDLIRFLWVCYRAYKATPANSVQYTALLDPYGIPKVTVIIGRDRAAWQLSQFAVEFKGGRGIV